VARPRKQAGSRRYFVTVTGEEAQRIDAYAASVERRPTTVAGELLLAGLAAASGEADADLAAARRRIEELERQLEAVFREHRPPPAEEAGPKRPRWEWPIAQLVADATWWDRWLPSLYELLGRRGAEAVAAYGSMRRGAVVDERGYTDLMSYLFPPVGAETGRPITWRSVDYPAAAAEAARRDGHEAVRPAARPHVWEPVVRHVAKALCALEECGRTGADPQLRLETDERITGSWVRTLRNLVGEAPIEPLPQPVP
jgi:hypothetical protein